MADETVEQTAAQQNGHGDRSSDGSLRARMQARRDELDSIRSHVFEVPRWEDVLAVELRLISLKRQIGVIEKHEKVRDTATKLLYTAADQLLLCTVGFYEVTESEDGEQRREPLEDMTWVKLALNLHPEADTLTPRQALIAVVGAEQILPLTNDWMEWMRGARPEQDREMRKDFTTTTSPS